jgi:hypothetical protein
VKAFVRSLALAAAACGLVSFSAQATIVGPGQSVSTSVEGAYATPGSLIAEQFLPDQAITYTPVAGSPIPVTPISLTVSLVNRVYRTSDGHLDFQLTSALDSGGLFGDGFTITSGDYAGFTTDAHALGANEFSRDLAGNVTVSGPAASSEMADRFPSYLIKTSATSFDKNGFATWSGDDTFSLFDAQSNPISVTAHAEFTVTGLYQPTGGGTAAVPLPPAAYGGLAMLAGIVATRARRHR